MDLPLVPLDGKKAIALLMTINMGVAFGERTGGELAELIASSRPEVVVGTVTLGIPVAVEVSRALGLDRYVVLQKSPKVHLGDALSRPVRSVTSRGEQRLLLDRRHAPLLRGRRVAVVDDVACTGSSLAAAIRLVRDAGVLVTSVGVLLTEGHDWREALGEDTRLLSALGHILQFARRDDGDAVLIEGTGQGRPKAVPGAASGTPRPPVGGRQILKTGVRGVIALPGAGRSLRGASAWPSGPSRPDPSRSKPRTSR